MSRKASFSSDRSNSSMTTDTPPNGEVASAAVAKATIDYATLPLTLQGELLVRTVQSNISSYPHPAVSLQFFECASRYAEFFKLRSDCVQPTLGSLLDGRGLHNDKPAVRHRAFYLFQRFIKDIRASISADFIPSILESMSDLLAIKPDVPERETAEEDLLVKATTMPSSFDAQLYLFETVGILISVMRNEPEQQLAFLQAACNPLLAEIARDIQIPTNGPDDILPILNVHHAVMALGNIAKGFPEPTENALTMAPPPWISVFKQSTEAILAVLERMNQHKVIRDAVSICLFDRASHATSKC